MRFLVLIVLLLAVPIAQAGQVVYYLHGKFLEENALDAVHPQFGKYHYHDILQVLGRDGAEVVSGLRPSDTDVSAHADKIVADIRTRIAAGQPPRDIAVVGASKGAVIGALVSTRLQEDDVAFVLMGACNEWLERTHRPRLRGRVLSIYDSGDDIAGSCKEIAHLSTNVAAFEEVRLDLGLGHGFLYLPREAWTTPALEWISRR